MVHRPVLRGETQSLAVDCVNGPVFRAQQRAGPAIALVAWVVTALGGFVLLGRWLQAGGQKPNSSRLPAPVVFGHFLLAAAGLVVWIIYVLTDRRLPLAVVAGHGVLAVATVVLVVLSALEIGGS